MDFLVRYNPRSDAPFRIIFCSHLNEVIPSENTIHIERLPHLDYYEKQVEASRIIAIGDVSVTRSDAEIIERTRGIFYLLTLSKENKALKIQADYHSFLPLYYFEQNGESYVSSSWKCISTLLTNKAVNPDFYTQIAILFTNIHRSTYYQELKRLEFGEEVIMDGQMIINRTHRFYEYFSDTPEPYSSAVERIADTFIRVSKNYLDVPCAISLTGGFDGRMITGCAHHFKTKFTNFSYGKRGSGDVDNPIWLAKKLGLKYTFIDLNEEYLRTDYQACVNDYLEFSGGFNGFQSPQSLYYAKVIARDASIIVTGYLGSEIFANPHSSDEECNPKAIIDYLKNGLTTDNHAYQLFPTLSSLNIVEDFDSINRVLHEAKQYFKSLPNHLTNNQMLAVYGFENVYRNMFGVWIFNNMHHVKLRVPLMDREFVNEITKTNVSQFYRRFLETDLRKRMVGQILYPHVLKKVWPELNALNSSKGYPPKDILTALGLLKISARKLLKINAFKEQNGLDKIATISGALRFISERKNDRDIQDLNIEEIQRIIGTNTLSRSLCFLALSKYQLNKLVSQTKKERRIL
ncbi:MAG: hypothetical protein FJY10_09020 [Bacteroidetes bacterium]|nr:hypothetical protein [Bacteroidota bacterium]